MAAQKDRLGALLDPSNTALNGIDFVEIATQDEKTLRVHFLNQVTVAGTIASVAIAGGESIPTVAVNPINDATDWSADAEGRPVLTLTVAAPGDFSFYTLTIKSSALDLFFDHSVFSFKALCPSELDCAPPARVCPPLAEDLPPIDYLAKDFLSFRKALSDFSTQRYPNWQERSEADFGVMFLEALSALADDLSYTQDRVAAEAAIDTATQRRSIVRLARLVDYEPRPATSARVLLQFGVSAAGSIPSGLLVSARAPDGATIFFEAGTGLIDQKTGALTTQSFALDPRWNSGIAPYWWDDSQRCLEAGATEMWVQGHGLGLTPGQALLIDTAAQTAADPPIREVIHPTAIIEEDDPLFPGPPAGPTPVTHLVWDASEALKSDHDLTRTVVGGNLVPATEGRRVIRETFAIDTPPPAALDTPLAVARTGPNSTTQNPAWQYLYTLSRPPLVYLAQDDPQALPLPEVVLSQQHSPQPIAWIWRRSVLEAEPFENAFTIDPVRYAVTASRGSDGLPTRDYYGDGGDTLRFGDGVFGGVPDPGDVFEVTYRTGSGARGNVAADTIARVEPGAPAFVLSVNNPFAARGGADPESVARVRRMAPQAFRARQFRAVLRKDYEAAAQTLPWVQRAGTAFRWTGSWLTVFTTPDPRGSELLPVDEHIELIDLLNRYRMAGYESYVPAPRYVSLDLYITVCAKPDAFRGDVQAAVLAALSASRAPDGSSGFFHPDNFTFGMPLERSALEGAIQNAYGVDGVVSILYRKRGVIASPVEMPDVVSVASDQILTVDNDPSRPERGSLHVTVEGGK